jgi:glycine/D-amino acid oxidase-like deaminating enzyme
MDFSMCGGHELFTDTQQFDLCAQAVARFNSWMEEIAGEKEVYKTDTVNGYPVICNQLEGYLHSGKLMKWLHTQIHEAGIEIRWGSRVKSVRSGVVGLENDIQLHAKTIILATNGFSKEIEHHAPITPARGYILLTNELDDMPWKGTWHYDKGFVYFRNIGNRLLLGGARNVDVTTEETTDDSVNPLIKAHLIQFLMETLKLKGWAVEQEWTGIMGFGPNKTPTCLEIKPGVWLAGGLSGMGVALGMQFGKEVAFTIDI